MEALPAASTPVSLASDHSEPFILLREKLGQYEDEDTWPRQGRPDAAQQRFLGGQRRVCVTDLRLPRPSDAKLQEAAGLGTCVASLAESNAALLAVGTAGGMLRLLLVPRDHPALTLKTTATQTHVLPVANRTAPDAVTCAAFHHAGGHPLVMGTLAGQLLVWEHKLVAPSAQGAGVSTSAFAALPASFAPSKLLRHTTHAAPVVAVACLWGLKELCCLSADARNLLFSSARLKAFSKELYGVRVPYEPPSPVVYLEVLPSYYPGHALFAPKPAPEARRPQQCAALVAVLCASHVDVLRLTWSSSDAASQELLQRIPAAAGAESSLPYCAWGMKTMEGAAVLAVGWGCTVQLIKIGPTTQGGGVAAEWDVTPHADGGRLVGVTWDRDQRHVFVYTQHQSSEFALPALLLLYKPFEPEGVRLLDIVAHSMLPVARPIASSHPSFHAAYCGRYSFPRLSRQLAGPVLLGSMQDAGANEMRVLHAAEHMSDSARIAAVEAVAESDLTAAGAAPLHSARGAALLSRFKLVLLMAAEGAQRCIGGDSHKTRTAQLTATIRAGGALRRSLQAYVQALSRAVRAAEAPEVDDAVGGEEELSAACELACAACWALNLTMPSPEALASPEGLEAQRAAASVKDANGGDDADSVLQWAFQQMSALECRTPFLDTLQRQVVRSGFPSLPPEVVGELVQHLRRTGRLTHITACLPRLIDAIIRAPSDVIGMCVEAQGALHSLYESVVNIAFFDYLSPAVVHLLLWADPGTAPDTRRLLADALHRYTCGCLDGTVVSLLAVPEEMHQEQRPLRETQAAAGMRFLLLHADQEDLLAAFRGAHGYSTAAQSPEWPPSAVRAATATPHALLWHLLCCHGPAALSVLYALLDGAGNGGGDGDGPEDTSFQAVRDVIPAGGLQRARAAVTAGGEAVASSQVVAGAVSRMLRRPGGGMASGTRAACLWLLADLMAGGRAMLDTQAVLMVLRHVAGGGAVSQESGDVLNGTASPSSSQHAPPCEPPPEIESAESSGEVGPPAEETTSEAGAEVAQSPASTASQGVGHRKVVPVVDLSAAGGRAAAERCAGAEAVFCGIAARLSGNDWRQGGAAYDAAVEMARQAGFFQALSELHDAAGRYEEAILALADAGGCQVFDYVRRRMSQLSEGSPERESFAEALATGIPALLRLDGRQTAECVLQSHLGEDRLAELLTDLPTRQLQHRLLHGLVTACASAPSSPAGRLLQRDDLLVLYVSLLCEFLPRAVLPALQSSRSLSVQAVLAADKVTQEFGVRDARAYLLERRGGAALGEAIDLHRLEIGDAGAALLRAVSDSGMQHPGSLLTREEGEERLPTSSGALLRACGAANGMGSFPAVRAALARVQQALHGAVGFCARNASVREQDSAEDRHTACGLWLSLLRHYVDELAAHQFSLRAEAPSGAEHAAESVTRCGQRTPMSAAALSALLAEPLPELQAEDLNEAAEVHSTTDTSAGCGAWPHALAAQWCCHAARQLLGHMQAAGVDRAAVLLRLMEVVGQLGQVREVISELVRDLQYESETHSIANRLLADQVIRAMQTQLQVASRAVTLPDCPTPEAAPDDGSEVSSSAGTDFVAPPRCPEEVNVDALAPAHMPAFDPTLPRYYGAPFTSTVHLTWRGVEPGSAAGAGAQSLDDMMMQLEQFAS